MGIGKRIKEARVLKHLTQEELAKKIGVTKGAIANYESETSHPKEPVMYALIDALGVDPNYLFQDSVNIKKSSPLSEDEVEVVREYRCLDKYGKKVVRAVIEEERRRVIEQSSEEDNVVELFPAREYNQPASAGYGDFNDDESFETIDLVKRPPAGMSFIIAVDGDSMEPTFQDGDLLFVRAQETLRYGEIGLFAIGGYLYIKEYGREGLISHNSAYEIIRPEEDTDVRVFGKVLGVCTEDYLSK